MAQFKNLGAGLFLQVGFEKPFHGVGDFCAFVFVYATRSAQISCRDEGKIFRNLLNGRLSERLSASVSSQNCLTPHCLRKHFQGSLPIFF